MPSQKGKELPPSSPEYQWVASVIKAVERRTGSTTRWNGRVFEEMDTGLLGTAHPDGTMTVSPSRVLDPVRQAYTGGRPLTDAENYRVRDAAATVTHEAVHLSASFGDADAPGAYPTHDPAAGALEEGQAERWTHRNLDDVIADVGLDRAQPGVLTQPNMDAYPAYTSASAELNSGLAARSGQSADQVAARLIGTERTQRWNAAADLVIDQRLGGLMPESHRDVVRAQVVEPMRTEFEKLPAAQADTTLTSTQKAALSTQAAERALSGVDHAVGHAEQHYQNFRQQQSVQQAQPSAEVSTSPEIAKLRGMMSGQAPAAGAVASPSEGARSDRSGEPTRPRTLPTKPLTPERG